LRAAADSGSASVSDAGDGVLAIAGFPCAFFPLPASEVSGKLRFGATPKSARMRRALPGTARFLRAIAVTSYISIAITIAAASEQTPSALTQIRSVLQAQQDAWNRGDIDGFMNGYVHSASTVFISEDTIRRGWQTVRDRYKQKYSNRAKMGTLSFSDLEITLLSSDSAVASGRWRLKRANDQPHGRFTLILKRLPQGWRIVHDHTSAASPTP
jgi:ketosteroid isomerase-like protein